MTRHFLLVCLLLFVWSKEDFAQKLKRQGVDPIDVSKNKRNAGNKAGTFKIEQFDGKWQEYLRKEMNQQEVAFKDTIYLNIHDVDVAETKQGNGMDMKGTASIEDPGNILTVAADDYAVIKLSDKEMLVSDQTKYYHYFKKEGRFNYEPYHQDSVFSENLDNPQPIVLNEIAGTWYVYKRQAQPGNVQLSDKLVKQITLEKSEDSTSTKGKITFYDAENAIVAGCTIHLIKNQLEIIAGNNTWNFFVFKQDNKELVFGNKEGVKYFSKKGTTIKN
jgi:hypothetical protein